MGQLFGISDLPVSTIETALEPNAGIEIPTRREYLITEPPKLERSPLADHYVVKGKVSNFSRSVLCTCNRIGKILRNINKYL